MWNNSLYIILRVIYEHTTETPRFAIDARVLFLRNPGGRAFRMPNVGQEISNRFRTLKGRRGFRTLRSYPDIAQERGPNQFGLLGRAFTGNLLQPASS